MEQILPQDFNYKVNEFKITQESNVLNENTFVATVLVNVCDEQEIETFLTEFKDISNTDYNKNKADTKSGKFVKLSGRRKCIHNVQKKGNKETKDQRSGMNTNCEAFIKFKLLKVEAHEHDDGCDKFPLEVHINYNHNHSVHSASAFKYHCVSEATKKQFEILFQEGHSASSAYAEFKNRLKSELEPEEFIRVLADRSVMPDYRWCFYSYSNFMSTNFGKINSPDTYRKATEFITKYNEKNKGLFAKIKQYESGDFIVAICDPLSQRVHEVVPAAGDICFVDATSNCDLQDTKIFRFITVSPAGGLPLGMCFTSNETEDTLVDAFSLLRDVIPDTGFYGKGRLEGPTIFLTDDCDSEMNALKKVWPKSIHLLCVWHVMNAVWRWLWQGSHKIEKQDRPALLKLFRNLVYTRTQDEFDVELENLLKDETCSKYPNYIRHLEKNYISRKEKWSLFYRYSEELPTHNCNTNNYVEISFRILKDNQMNRTKAYNLIELLQILFDDSAHFRKKLIDVGNGRFSELQPSKSRYNVKEISTIKKDQCSEICDKMFIVQSESDEETFYTIDMESGYCECRQGMLRGPCKHKAAVQHYYNVAEFSGIPVFDNQARSLYHYIAEGIVLNDQWYRSLNNPAEEITVYVEVHTHEHDAEIVVEPQDNSEETEAEVRDVGDDGDVADVGDVADDGDVGEVADETDSDSELLSEYVENIEKLKAQNLANILDEGVKRSVKYFNKKIRKMLTGTTQALQKINYSLGQELSSVAGKGKKRKIGRRINVQPTALARRTFPSKGKSAARHGRRQKDQEPGRRQMVLNQSDEEEVYFSLPKQKKRKTQHKHSLKESVDNNRPNPKKH